MLNCKTCISAVIGLAIVGLLSYIALTEGFQSGGGGMSHDPAWKAPWAPQTFPEEEDEPEQNQLAWNPATLPAPYRVRTAAAESTP